MRRFMAFAAACVVMPGVLCAQQAGTAKTGQTPPGVTSDSSYAESLIKLTFRPGSVQHTYYVNFDEQGNIRSTQSRLNVGLQVQYESPSQVYPIMIRNIQATRVVTDTGHPMTPQSGSSEQTLYYWERQRPIEARRQFHLNLNFTPPETPVAAIKEISGTMEVVCGSGEQVEAVLSPVSDYLDKQVRFREFPGMYVKIMRSGEKRVRVEMAAQFRPHIAGVAFFDAGGAELAFNSRSGSESGATIVREFELDLPDDGRVRLRMFPIVEARLVPFEIRDIPLTIRQQGENVTVPVGKATDDEGSRSGVSPVVE